MSRAWVDILRETPGRSVGTVSTRYPRPEGGTLREGRYGYDRGCEGSFEIRDSSSDHRSAGQGLISEYTKGIALCQRGEYAEGLLSLRQGLIRMGDAESAPPLVLSHMGHAMAKAEGKIDQGLELCKRAVREQFLEPDLLVNLARTQLLAGDRQQAVLLVKRGLKVDPESRRLLDLQAEIGTRSPRFFSFLSRRNFINRLFGRLRHMIGS